MQGTNRVPSSDDTRNWRNWYKFVLCCLICQLLKKHQTVGSSGRYGVSFQSDSIAQAITLHEGRIKCATIQQTIGLQTSGTIAIASYSTSSRALFEPITSFPPQDTRLCMPIPSSLCILFAHYSLVMSKADSTS